MAKPNYDNYDIEYTDIKNIVELVNTSYLSDLEIYYAAVKQSGGFTKLNLIVRTQSGFPTNIALPPLIRIPVKYRPKNLIYTYCRVNENYDYPAWDSNDNIAFCNIDTAGLITIRTNLSGKKVAVFDLIY